MKLSDIKRIDWKVSLWWESAPSYTISIETDLKKAVLKLVQDYNEQCRAVDDEGFKKWLDAGCDSVKREIKTGDVLQIRRLKQNEEDEYLTDCSFWYKDDGCELLRGGELGIEESVRQMFEEIEKREDPETAGDFAKIVKSEQEKYPTELIILQIARYGRMVRKGKVARFE